MTCHDAREWLSDLLDEALEADRRVEVEAHLAGCAECRFELDRLRATVGALRGLEHPRAPAGFVGRVVQRVHPMPWYRRLGAWLFLPRSVKLPAGAAAAVVLAGLAMLVWERTPEFRSAARQEFATRSAPSIATVDPTPRAPSQNPPAPAEMPRPSKPPRARSEERPPSSPPPTESQDPSAPAEPKAGAPATPTPEPKTAAPPAPETKATAPPAPAAKSESEVRAAPPPQPLAPPRLLAPPQPLARPGPPAAQSDRSELRARATPQTVRRTLGAAPSSDLAGRLIVRDRDAAVVSLVELVSKVGGYEIGRRQDAGDAVIDVQIPAARYDEFVRALDALGSWTAAGAPNVLPLEPPQIRMTIRLTG